MLIPIGTDRPRRRRPRATGTIIVLNMLVYLFAMVLEAGGGARLDAFMNAMALSKAGLADGEFWQLLTYQFAHSPVDLFHLAFNMLFLWIFGSALEDRMGHVNFVIFLVMGGGVAGLAHTLTSIAPVIGASGAVCAATGGFIVLFPRARIRILLFFFLIGVYMIPAMWVVAFQVIVDMVGWFNPQGAVAYSAHLAGYAYGFLLAVLLVATGIVKSDEFDLPFLMKQRRRRAAYRRVVNETDSTSRLNQSPDSKPIPVLTETDQDPEEATLRSKVIRLIRHDRMEEAQVAFRDLMSSHPRAVLPESTQLEIANRLQSLGDREAAAGAYERFLDAYPSSRQAPEVRLLLASLLIRFLERPEDAKPLLEEALPDLKSDGHRALARRLLEDTNQESMS